MTDANLLLGRLDPEAFLGGRMRLDVERAWDVARGMAMQLRRTVDQLAEGIVRAANAGMERAIRVVSVERGYDPRHFALVAFGGAGGMHAGDLAAQLSVDTVLVPRHAGVLSALGMLLADVTRDYSATVLRASARLTARDLARSYAPLIARATRDLRADGFGRARQIIRRRLDVRYVGQSHEITVDWTPGYEREFHRAHARRYGYADPARPTEVVAIRVMASGLVATPPLPFTRPLARPAGPGVIRMARFGGRPWPTRFYRWEVLSPGAGAGGPAVLAGAEATVVVPPEFVFSIDGFGNVVMNRRPGRRLRGRSGRR